jgi:hypothetical protein
MDKALMLEGLAAMVNISTEAGPITTEAGY